jgi:hypothetical protein
MQESISRDLALDHLCGRNVGPPVSGELLFRPQFLMISLLATMIQCGAFHGSDRFTAAVSIRQRRVTGRKCDVPEGWLGNCVR